MIGKRMLPPRRLALAVCFLCGMTTARADQPVRVSANPHWLEFRGQPILPIGDSATQGWMESGADFDQRGYLDALAARGMNAVLLWSYVATSAEAQRADRRIGYDAPELSQWRGSTDSRDVDLTAFNPAYFARLREFVRLAEQRGILVVLTVQDGWPKTKFAHHPFNAALGNGPLTDRKQLIELADYDDEMANSYDPKWTWQQKNQHLQERFADKLCVELKDRSNVIFEMFNEGEWYDKDQRRRHEEHFLRFFRKRTTAPLMTNLDHIRTPNYEPRRNPAVDILSLHSLPWTGHYKMFVKEFQTEPTRVVFESEPVPAIGGWEPAQQGRPLTTPEIVRRTVWERALAGAGFVAQNDTSFAWNPKCGIAVQARLRDETYDLLGHAARFFNQSGVAFWAMAPEGKLSSTGMCLAKPGVEYVAYAPTNAGFTMNLEAAKDKSLAVRWYDPRTGRFRPSGIVSGGNAAQTFTPPFPGDAVLHLKAVPND